MHRPPDPTQVARDHKMNTDNEPFEMMEQFSYFGIALTNQNSVHEEIKSKLKSGNAS